jgi:hypothetical protein
LILISVLALGLGLPLGCADDPAPIKPDTSDGTDSDVDPDGPDGDVNPDGDIDISGCVSLTDPAGDVDNDGVPNIKEDKNADCQYNPELNETDFQNDDTDGDGLKDGQEDVNGNGIWDAGEKWDPRKTDTNGDGVDDYTEWLSEGVVCNDEIYDLVKNQPAQFAFSTVALPEDYVLTQHSDAKAMTFTNANDKAYGLVIATVAGSSNPGLENSTNVLKVARGANGSIGDADDNVPTISYSTEFTAPSNSTTEYPLITPVNGVQVKAIFSYGPGEPNSNVNSRSPAELRDQIASSISGKTVSTSDTAEPCSKITAYWLAQLRTDPWTVDRPGGTPQLVTTVILTCDENLSNAELGFLFSDVLSGTQTAPGNYSTDKKYADFKCQTMPAQASGGEVDFLWVIDNSGSMADEQTSVANTASKFMDSLITAGVQWRIGVTTTETYLLWNDPPDPIAHDKILDSPTGLRGAGFLRYDENDARQLFEQYVRFDQGCIKTDGSAPPNSNVCGTGLEDGLASGYLVLDATTTDVRDSYKRRNSAKVVVVWVSDEEIQPVKLDDPTIPITPEDPRWQPIIDGYVAQYQRHEALGYAIVGDQLKEKGGICSQLDSSPSAIEGAQYGQSYLQVASALDGGSGSICAPDLQPTIDAMIKEIIGVASVYELDGYPIASSIRVAIDGEIKERSNTKGWDYDPKNNTITFYGTPFTEASTIVVSYLMWGELDAG